MTGNFMLVLPVSVYSLFVWLNVGRAGERDIVSGFIKGHLAFFCFVLVLTELLSLGNLLLPSVVQISWIVCVLVLMILVRRKHRLVRSVGDRALWKRWLEWSVWGSIIIIVAVFASGILYPPNNWDSLCYHLPKVMHWASSGSVSFFPTPDSRQNFMAPLAEYTILHIYLLSGSDCFFFLVQWVSFFVFGLSSCLMTVYLGGSHRLGLISMLLCLSLPMAILQGSSTQNDLVLASFVCSFATFMMRGSIDVKNGGYLWASIAMGLALMTKGTGYVYCAALGSVWGVWGIWNRRHRMRAALGYAASLAMVAVLALLMNAGHYSRNIRTYGHPLSNEAESTQNKDISIESMRDNAVRNILIQLGGPFPSINSRLEAFGRHVLGDRVEHPSTTFPGIDFRVMGIRHEDLAGNPIHTALALIFFVPCFVYGLRKRQSTWVVFAVSWIGMGLLLCLMLRWQMWGSRLHLPVFGVMIPWFVYLMFQMQEGFRFWKSIVRWVGIGAVAACWAYAMPFAFGNGTRSLVSMEWKHNDRQDLYGWPLSRVGPSMLSDVRYAVKLCRTSGQKQVGLWMKPDIEYLYWIISNDGVNWVDHLQFRHLYVPDASALLAPESSSPMWIISSLESMDGLGSCGYRVVWAGTSVAIYLRPI